MAPAPLAPHAAQSHATRDQLRRLLEAELARVDSPEAAERVMELLERLTAGETEQQRGQAAAGTPATAAVEQAARTPGRRRDQVAAVLAETAAEAVAPTPEAPAVVEAAQEAAGTRPRPPGAAPVPPPEVTRGRDFLQEVVLRRMRPLQRLDAGLFLLVNRLPHPRWADRLANATSVLTVGGALWLGLLALAAALKLPRSREALALALPCVAGAGLTVEYPIKALFRRRRPFIDIVRALVVGKKPGSWSFPSGHTAASFATAWTLSTIWPRRAPLFFSLAAYVAFSRVYVGAHYPGDVASGALLGTILSDVVRRTILGARKGLR